MSITVKSHYETKDLGLVATLLCFGVTEDVMTCIDKDKRLFKFGYVRAEKMMEIKDQYYKNDVKVNPVQLLQNVKNLKAKMEDYNVD